MASSAVRRAREDSSSATHSGKLLLRMSPTLHARLAAEAERRGVSLNQLITSRLEESLSKPGQARSAPGPAAAPAASASKASPRLTSLALGINLVVVLVAGVIAVVLLVLALADLA
jgi:HicB family